MAPRRNVMRRYGNTSSPSIGRLTHLWHQVWGRYDLPSVTARRRSTESPGGRTPLPWNRSAHMVDDQRGTTFSPGIHAVKRSRIQFFFAHTANGVIQKGAESTIAVWDIRWKIPGRLKNFRFHRTELLRHQLLVRGAIGLGAQPLAHLLRRWRRGRM